MEPLRLTTNEFNFMVAASPAKEVVKSGGYIVNTYVENGDWASDKYKWQRIEITDWNRAGRRPSYFVCMNTRIIRDETIGEFYGNETKSLTPVKRSVRVEVSQVYYVEVEATSENYAKKLAEEVDLSKLTPDQTKKYVTYTGR